MTSTSDECFSPRTSVVIGTGSPPSRDDPLLDVIHAAAYLGVKERLIRRLVAQRRIPWVKIGRFVRFAQSDLDEYISRNRHDAILGQTGRREKPCVVAAKRGLIPWGDGNAEKSM